MVCHYLWFLVLSIVAILQLTSAQYPVVDQECPDPQKRNPYDPSLAFNKKLDASQAVHGHSATLVARFRDFITTDKIGFSHKVPIFQVPEGDSAWELFDVYFADLTTQWTIDYNGAPYAVQFRVPPAALSQNVYAPSRSASDLGLEDWPFIIMDENHPVLGDLGPVELRGFETQIDYTAKTFYCTGCGLFRVNNDGASPGGSLSLGEPFAGQGTGCGLSWPGVVRKEDIQSGQIAHAIRVAFSSCDFVARITGNEYVAPAIKTDQPKGVASSPDLNDNEKVMMGYRYRLKASTDCDTRLAPMFRQNGNWYPPTPQMTDFVRMFCRAVRDFGFILSDGLGGCGGLTFQGEHEITGEWQTLFGGVDESSMDGQGNPYWGYLLRDLTTETGVTGGSPNRYRDERYGIPWSELEVLATSTDGEANSCCGATPVCQAPTLPPTPLAWVDPDPDMSVPRCTNEYCCFKHRQISFVLRIADDDCVVYGNTFSNVDSSNIIFVATKRDGTKSNNILIAANSFAVSASTDQDAIHLADASEVTIRDNSFSGTLASGYNWITIENVANVDISSQTFPASASRTGIMIRGPLAQDVTIGPGNAFTGLGYGVQVYHAQNLVIRSNTFSSIDSSTSSSALYFRPVDEPYDAGSGLVPAVTGLVIESNAITDCRRGIFLSKNLAAVRIADNTIRGISGDSSRSHAIELADESGTTAAVLIEGNTISEVQKYGVYLRPASQDVHIRSNLMYDMTDRDIYVLGISGYTPAAGTSQLVVENNRIYSQTTSPNRDCIYLNLGGSSQTGHAVTYVRFNSLYNSQRIMNVWASSSPVVHAYCNIAVCGAESYFNGVTSNELNVVTPDISQVLFVNDNLDAADLSTVDFRLQTGSPARAFCNALDTATYPLTATDFEGHARQSPDIDAGADQVSGDTPAPTTSAPTASPTMAPTNNPTSVTSNPTTSAPTAPQPSVSPTSSPTALPTDLPTSQSPTASPTAVPTANPAVPAPSGTCTVPNCMCTGVTFNSKVIVDGDNCVFDGCTFKDIADEAIKISSRSNTVIRGCRFENIAQEAIEFGTGSSDRPNGVTIEDNEFVDCQQEAIKGKNLDGAILIRGNTFTRIATSSTSKHCITFYNPDSADQVATSLVVENNAMTNIGGRGVYIDDGHGGVVFRSNVVDTTGDDAVRIEGFGYEIVGNTIRNSASGNEPAIYLNQCGKTIAGNTIHTTEYGIRLQYNYVCDSSAEPMVIENNVIYDVKASAISMSRGSGATTPLLVLIRSNTLVAKNDYRVIEKSSSETVLSMHVYGNILIRESTTTGTSSGPWFRESSADSSDKNAKVYQNIDSSSSQYKGTPTATTFAALQFVDAANGNYHIASGSFAIGFVNGIDSTAFPLTNVDIDGDARSTSGGDAGADELAAPFVAGAGQDPSGLSNAWILVTVVCVVLLLAGFAIAIYCYLNKRKQSAAAENDAGANASQPKQQIPVFRGASIDAATPIDVRVATGGGNNETFTPLTPLREADAVTAFEDQQQQQRSSAFGSAAKALYQE